MKNSAPETSLVSTSLAGRSAAIFAVFLAAVLAWTWPARAQGASLRDETFTLGAEGQVRIENAAGSTRVEVWPNPSVRVVAEKRAPASTGLLPSELVLMGAQNTILVQCRPGEPQARIDLRVYVPARAHLHVVAGAQPVEVVGPLASAVVETTSGRIDYQIPRDADARVVMNSRRGAVRSTLPLADTLKAGAGSLQGRLGQGSAPLILNSQSGAITLAPAPYAVAAMRGLDIPQQSAPQPGSESEAQDGESASSRTTIPSVIGGRSSSQQSSRSSGHSRPAPAGVEDEPEDDPDLITLPPRGGQPRSGGNIAVFGGTGTSTQASQDERFGPMYRPRREEEQRASSMGIGVRIIPSNEALGSRRQSDDVEEIYGPPPGLPNEPEDARRNPRGGNARPSAGGRDSRTQGNVPSRSGGAARQGAYDRDMSIWPSAGREAEEEAAESRSRPSAPPVLKRDDAPDAGPATAAAAEPAGASEEEAIRLESSLVNLNVSVTDRSGRALGNLRKEDFEVYENNQPQPVEFFQSQNTPFNLVLLLDLSGSIQDKLDVVKSAALKFVDEVGPNDRVAVIAFSQEVQLISGLTSNRDLLRNRIRSIDKPEGGTAFYEAMWYALVDTLRGTAGQRNAIVVMSDGVDSSLDFANPMPTRVTFSQLARRLEESDVMVFPIYLDTEWDEVFNRMQSSSEAYAVARQQLEKLAQISGGEYFRAERAKDLAGVYKQVAASLRTVYSIGYYPTNPARDGSYRRVRVMVNRGDAAVRTRRGYYAK